MGRILIICSVAVVLLSVAVYRHFPTFPAGFEVSRKEKLQTVLGTRFFKLLLALEEFGLIEDSAIKFREMSGGAFPDFSKDPSHTSEIIIENTTIAEVPVLIFRPRKEQQNPTAGTLIYFHGGAFNGLSPLSHFLWTKMLAIEAGVVVISVHYRLAPEHPFPIGVEDCLRVTKTVFDEAETFFTDRSRIMVGGDSSGGNFAAVVAIELASSPNYRLRGQLLLSPVLQAVEILPSAKAYGWLLPFPINWVIAKYAGQPFSEEISSAMEDSRFYISESDKEPFGRYLSMVNLKDDVRALVDTEKTTDDKKKSAISSEPSKSVKTVLGKLRDLVLNERAWPLLTTDDEKLRRMCPTFISVAEFDPLRDEELLYYERLRSLGAKVTLSYFRGGGHTGPIKAVMTNQPFSENARTNFISHVIKFIKDQMLRDD